MSTNAVSNGGYLARAALWRNGQLTVLTPTVPSDVVYAFATDISNCWGMWAGYFISYDDASHTTTSASSKVEILAWTEAGGLVVVRPDLWQVVPSRINASDAVVGESSRPGLARTSRLSGTAQLGLAR